jgi:hypothetical protein
MSKKTLTFLLTAMAVCWPLSTLQAKEQAETEAPQWTTEGLELVDKSRRGETYADPDIDWTTFTEIILDRPSVAFRKNWQRDQNRYDKFKVRNDDMERIKGELADLFEEVFNTRTAGRTTSYTESAGRMTLKLAIHDSVTGDLIATVSHRQEAPRRGYMQWTNSVTNRAEARRMLERWAKDLRERLDEARSSDQ